MNSRMAFGCNRHDTSRQIEMATAHIVYILLYIDVEYASAWI